MSTSATGEYVFYQYNPSQPAAIVMIALFGLSTFYHGFQLLLKRTWFFIPFFIGGLFECIGYVGRTLSANESPNWTTGPYIMQSLLILLAPAFFAASIYMVLSRVILLTEGESHALIRTKWLTKIFVLGDVLSFLAQGAGGGMLAKAKNSDDIKLGEHIITAGLGIQILFFVGFIIVAALFHVKIRKAPTTRSLELTVPWERLLCVLYTASALILIRSAFRVVEYVMGSDGFLLSNEVYLYVFDTALVFVMMFLLNVFHPGQIISKSRLMKRPVASHARGRTQRAQRARPRKH